MISVLSDFLDPVSCFVPNNLQNDHVPSSPLAFSSFVCFWLCDCSLLVALFIQKDGRNSKDTLGVVIDTYN